MKKKLQYLLLPIAAIFFATACSSDDDNNGGGGGTADQIKLSEYDIKIAEENGTHEIKILSGQAPFAVSSSADSVATASADSVKILIKARSVGKTTIEVKDKNLFTAKIFVTVGNPPTVLNHNEYLNVNDNRQLTVWSLDELGQPRYVDNRNPSVATVEAKDKWLYIQALDSGSTNIEVGFEAYRLKIQAQVFPENQIILYNEAFGAFTNNTITIPYGKTTPLQILSSEGGFKAVSENPRWIGAEVVKPYEGSNYEVRLTPATRIRTTIIVSDTINNRKTVLDVTSR